MFFIDKWYGKIVVSGNIVELHKYEKLNVNGGGARYGDGRDREHNYSQSQRRRRNTIRQLICSNFDCNSKFVTLTFRDDMPFDIHNVKACNKFFMRFVLRVRYRFPDFKYVAVIEFQDKNGRGAVHYHMICNLPYVKKAELCSLWSGGFVKINAIDNVDNVGAYVIKYMTSDMDDKRLMDLNAYLHSQGLKKPVEVTTWRDSDSEAFQEIYDSLKSETPSYCCEYESDNAGHIEYMQFNFNQSIAH